MENINLNINSNVILFNSNGEIGVLDDININKKKSIISTELPYYSPELKVNLLEIKPFQNYDHANVFSLGLTFLQMKSKLK